MKPSALCVSKVFAASALLVTVRGHNAEYTLHFSQPCGLKEKNTKVVILSDCIGIDAAMADSASEC